MVHEYTFIMFVMFVILIVLFLGIVVMLFTLKKKINDVGDKVSEANKLFFDIKNKM